MTAFLTSGVAGIGSQNAGSSSARALREIDSRKLSYANKDFVKNIAWLNQSVDTLSQYTQKLEKGVTQANMNALEQVQGIWGDLFILFAGLEPTDIDVGDVKYILQGIGAFYGINPDTPFPLNLLEASAHMFTNYIVPLPQFTDVVFDSIIAWAEDFGLSEEFVTSLEELRTAIEGLGESYEDLFNALKELMAAFGFFDWTSTSGLGDLWNALIDFIGNIGDIEALKPMLSLLSTLGVPFINALTNIVNGGSTFLGYISGDQVRTLGDNVTPPPSEDTTVWSVGGSTTAAWQFDSGTNAPGSTAGSFTTLGTGVAKRLITQGIFKAKPGDKFAVNTQLRWQGIPSGANDFGVALVFFNGATEVSQSNISIAAGHGASGGFSAVTPVEIEVPINVDGFKIASYVGTGINTGQVWTAVTTVQRTGQLSTSVVDGLADFIAKVVAFFAQFSDLTSGSFDPLTALQGLFDNTTFNDRMSAIYDFAFGAVASMITDGTWSPSGLAGLDWLAETVRKVWFGLDGIDLDGDPGSVLQAILSNIPVLSGLIDLSWLTDEHQNLVKESGYDAPITVATDDPQITHDATDGVTGSSPLGCMKIVADGTNHERIGEFIKVGKNWELDIQTAVKWIGITATASSNAIRLELQPFSIVNNVSTPVGSRILIGGVASPTGTSGGTGGWGTSISGTYTVPGDGSVTHIALIPRVTSNASAGTIKFDDTEAYATQPIPQNFVFDLPDLQQYFNVLLDIFSSATVTPPTPVLQDVKDWWANVNVSFDEMTSSFVGDILEAPTNALTTAIDAFYSRFFQSGPERVLVQEQLAISGGMPPLDAVVNIPYEFLPDDFVSYALGWQWGECSKTVQNITANTDTLLGGWSQPGSAPFDPLTLTITSGTTISVPWNGLYNFEIDVDWAGDGTTNGSTQIFFMQNGSYIRKSPINPQDGDLNTINVILPAAAADEFKVYARSNSTNDQVSVAGTRFRVTFLGNTTVPNIPILEPVTFDAVGGGGSGSHSSFSFDHTFGADATAIFFSGAYAQLSNATIQVWVRNAADTANEFQIPLTSGKTYIGNYFGYDCYGIAQAVLIPGSLQGVTRKIRVTTGGVTIPASFNTTTFNGVSSIGNLKTVTGTGGPNILVPSNAYSMVAVGMHGMDVNFSGFNRTNDYQVPFSAYITTPHVLGHAVGGSQFNATNSSKWCAKGVELHP